MSEGLNGYFGTVVVIVAKLYPLKGSSQGGCLFSSG